MNDERKQQQRDNNLKILSTIGDQEANRGHIFNRAWKRIQAMKVVVTLLKRKRMDEQRALTNIELYADDWAFHHGTPIDAPDKPNGNFKEFAADCVDRMVTLHQRKEHAKEDAGFQQMQGSLVDGFDDDQMHSHPSDADIEAALIKANPELKRFR
jgi:hypothetical protein